MAVFKNGIFARYNGQIITPQSLGISLSGIQACQEYFSSASIDDDTQKYDLYKLVADLGNSGVQATALSLEVCIPFIASANITDDTQKYALYGLVVDLENYNIWDKMKVIYPFIGGSATAHKYNLKDSRDSDDAYRLAFQPTGWIHSNTGALPNGGTYANTFFAPSLLDLDSAHMSYYSRTATTSTSVDMGVGQTGFGDFYLAPRYSTGLYDISRINSGYPGGGTATVSQGLFTVSRVSSTGFKTYKNDAILTDRPSATSTTAATLPIWIGAINLNGGIGDRTTREVAFASIGDGLTDTEAANLYTAVQRFQTTLGRQV